MAVVIRQESHLWFSIPLDANREEDVRVASELNAMAVGMRRTLIRHLLAEALCCDRAIIEKTLEAAIARRNKRGEKKRGRPGRKDTTVPKAVESSPVVPVQVAQRRTTSVVVLQETVEQQNEIAVGSQTSGAEQFNGLLGSTVW